MVDALWGLVVITNHNYAAANTVHDGDGQPVYAHPAIEMAGFDLAKADFEDEAGEDADDERDSD
jgi:hypothetical protein